MTHPGPDYPAPAQPGTPEAAWAPQDAPQEPTEKKSGAKKWASIAGTVAVVGVGAAYTLTGHFGIGDPAVNDCVHMKSETDFEVVDCLVQRRRRQGHRHRGREEDRERVHGRPEHLLGVRRRPRAALWYQNGMITDKGTVYCVVSPGELTPPAR